MLVSNGSGSHESRRRPLPYGRQTIEDDDVAAVANALRSEWLTTGPMVDAFESAFAQWVGCREAVAVNSGTAALHAAVAALGLRSGDEVIVPALTFVASANCALYVGARPVFADVDPSTLLLDPSEIVRRRTSRTRAVITVDYAGQPCDYDAIREIAGDLAVIADSCHAPGARYRGRSVGTLADISTFSLHPVKHFTTGEGGIAATDNPELARRMRVFRNHGIASSHREREERVTWWYEMVDLGFNYRLTDFQCALGMSQLGKIDEWINARRRIARMYDERLASVRGVQPLGVRPEVSHAYHLYVVRLTDEYGVPRDLAFRRLREAGIGVNVHYIPVHLHPYYRTRLDTREGQCPVAERLYREILSLPIFPAMNEDDIDRVVDMLRRIPGS